MKRSLITVLALMLCLCLPFAVLGEEDDIDMYGEDAGFVIQNGVLIIDEGVTSLGMDGGEHNCDLSTVMLYNVVGVELPATVKHLGELCLYGLGAKALVVPEGVESIGELAFQHSDLESVSLPSTLTALYDGTFADCDDLAHIAISPDNPMYMVKDDVLFTKDGQTLLFYPSGKTDAHYDVPAGVTRIGDGAFIGNDHLESVSLPLGLTTIENYGFNDCGALRSVALPLTLKTIGDYGFANCVNLEQIAVSGNVTAGQMIFYNCPRLKGYAQWQEPDLEPDDPYVFSGGEDTYGIVNPENVADTVPLYDGPDPSTPALAQLGCGTTVLITGQELGYYQVSLAVTGEQSAVEGWLPCGLVVQSAPTQGLYTLAGAAPIGPKAVYYDDLYALPLQEEKHAFRLEWTTDSPSQCGQWIEVTQHGSGLTEYNETVFAYCNAFPEALLLTRHDTGDGKTYGMVVSSNPQSRLNVREQPDKGAKALGKYFSGAQVEVLGEAGDWYRIRVAAYDLSGYMEGYAMKTFIRVIPVEE